MRTLLPCLLCAALAFAAHAQSPCPNPDLSSHPGAWKPRAGYVGPARFRAAPGSNNRAAADATLTKLLALLQAAYPEPRGGMAYFDKSFTFSSPDRELPFGYSLYVGHSGFSCTSANRLVESVESGVFINVDVNTFLNTSMLSIVTAPEISTSAGSVKLNADEEGNYRIGGRIAYRVPAVATRSADADRYSITSRADRGGAPTEQYIVLRKNETPLFTYITRREYLQQFRGELETYKSREMEGARANAGTPGASNPEWQARFAKGMDAYLRSVDAYLRSAPEAELSRPVSELLSHFPIDLDNPQVRFRQDDFHLVHFNHTYLDKKLPLHIPQFIVIRWSVKDTPKSPAWEANFREHISNRLDFAAIRALLTGAGR